jgi:hypothetical protein
MILIKITGILRAGKNKNPSQNECEVSRKKYDNMLYDNMLSDNMMFSDIMLSDNINIR